MPQEHNTMTRPGFEPGPLDLESRSPTVQKLSSFTFLDNVRENFGATYDSLLLPGRVSSWEIIRPYCGKFPCLSHNQCRNLGSQLCLC